MRREAPEAQGGMRRAEARKSSVRDGLRGLADILVRESLEAQDPSHHAGDLREPHPPAYHPGDRGHPAEQADAERPAAVLRSAQEKRPEAVHRQVRRRAVRPNGAYVSRHLPLRIGEGGAGWADPCEPGHWLQAAAQEGTGDAGTDAGGTTTVPYPSKVRGILRSVPSGLSHRPAPWRAHGAAVG